MAYLPSEPSERRARDGIVRLKAEDVIRLFVRHNPLMRTSVYHRHRFPAEIISHCVWLYFRFALSFRDVEEMLAMRGVTLSYETVREWCLKFGQTYANGLRHKSRRPGDRWHLDEVFLRILCCRPHLIFYVAKIVMWHIVVELL